MDREDHLRADWFQRVGDFKYELDEYGFDAIQDGLPDDVRTLFEKLRKDLAALEQIAVECAEFANARYETNG